MTRTLTGVRTVHVRRAPTAPTCLPPMRTSLALPSTVVSVHSATRTTMASVSVRTTPSNWHKQTIRGLPSSPFHLKLPSYLKTAQAALVTKLECTCCSHCQNKGWNTNFLNHRANCVEYTSDNIKSAENVITFRRHLKTYLFNLTYPL